MLPEILFEDNKIIVVVKPPGMLSQSDFTDRPDLLNYLKAHVKEKYNKPGDAFLGLVHRLDKEVGGVMVFARNSKSARNLSEQIVNHQFEKTYIAQIENWSLGESGKLNDYLLKDEYKNITEFSSPDNSKAKKSELEYKLINKSKDFALVEIKLITGRSHQIRAQFGLRGMSLMGDKKYGSKSKINTIRLWAYKLGFKHPGTSAKIIFESSPNWV